MPLKILILASNPRKDLHLDREIRDLRAVIETSRNWQEFEVEDALAVRVGDLQELLFRHRPQIVHFCGHGSGRQGLVFESNSGGEQWVRTEALSDLFRLFSQNVGCVLLNACYSEEQANAIVNHIDYVIGMNQEIRDDAAIAFSKGFYRALGYACSVEQAFEFGKNAIQLEISGSSKMRSAAEADRKAEVVDAIQQTAIPEHLKPILKIKPALAANSKAAATVPEQLISQETRIEIQVDIDKSLEADAKVKQYRDQVREFLSDRKISPLEEIRLNRLRQDLGLSESAANRILEEELQPIRKAQADYEALLIDLIEAGHYPFDAAIQSELQAVQQQMGLSDQEIAALAAPILAAAAAEYQKRLQQQQQEYAARLQRYQQEFSKAARTEYPLSRYVLDGLSRFWQQLELQEVDVAQVEHAILAPLEASYQEQLKQQELAERQRRIKLAVPNAKPGTASVVAIQLDDSGFSVALLQDGQAFMIPNSQGNLKTPAIIAHTAKGEWLIGQAAQDQISTNPTHVFEGILNFLGRRYSEVAGETAYFSYRIIEDSNGFVKINCPGLNQQLKPEAILAHGLRNLINTASQDLGWQIQKVMISVPSCFTLLQRRAVQDAARLAQLKCIRVVDSSTIAAIAFTIQVQQSSETILVVDASEKYISASVLVVGDGVFEVLAISGKRFFNKEQQSILSALSELLEAILARARVNKADLEKIFLTGSISCIEAVEICIQQVIHQQVTKTDFSEIAVALGAAIQAGVLSGLISDILLLGATHSDFSIRTADGKAATIISTAFSIPTKKSEKFTTITDYQTSVEVPVLQIVHGMTEADAEITHLGSFRLDGIAPAPAGIPQIEITFDIDADGLLSITAKDQANGQKISMVDRDLYQGLKVRSTIREWNDSETTASSQSQTNDDLEIPLKLTNAEMNRGIQKEIKLEGGEKVIVKIPAGVKPGQRIRVRGKGRFNSSKQTYGDLYLRIVE